MKKIILTPEQINNLSVFLDRVQITGIQENLAFNSILQAIDKAEEINIKNNNGTIKSK